MKEVNVENGKIVLKNLKNLLHIENINYKVPKAENAAIAITAPNVSEYKKSHKNVDISAFLFFMLSKMGVSRKEKL